MRYLYQLEPDELVCDFFRHPPCDFVAWKTTSNIPVFSARFDLLTTADDSLRKSVVKLPFYSSWGEWLKPYTCFVGTTVSEYLLAPAELSAPALVAELKQELAKKYSFLIMKDIPQASPLLPDVVNQQASQLILAAQAVGFVIVEGQALAWVPIDFNSLDEYLARLSKNRRKNIRRKLKSQESLTIDILQTGSDFFTVKENQDEFYQLYLNVYAQSEIHFDELTKAFFIAVLTSTTNGGIVFVYREGDKIIGYNICFVVGTHLVDKYVGFLYPAARDKNLYFVSWFVNLQYALDHQLTHYIAGWTDPEVKKSLGAQFTFTSHAVHVRNPILRRILKPLAFLFERDANALEKIQHEDARNE